mmetsp:Transcript_38259/g.113726  ORF Transcript_38259/g.113726 Transcript_38259/m.113726 type:complete len:257 (+) Transcript_38259:539-1309(+)
MWHVELFVERNRLGDEGGVEAEEAVVEESREVLRHLLRVLEAAAHPPGQRLRVGHLVVFAEVRVVGVKRVHLEAVRMGEPAHKHVDHLCVVVLVDPVVVQHQARAEHAHPPRRASRPCLARPQRAHGPIERQREGAGRQHREGRLLHRERRAVRKDKREAARASRRPACTLLERRVEHPSLHMHLLWVRVLVVHRAEDRVAVARDAKLLGEIVDVGAQRGLAALAQRDEQRPPLSHVRLERVELCLAELFAWRGDN